MNSVRGQGERSEQGAPVRYRRWASREKLESVQRKGEREDGGRVHKQTGGMKEKCSGTARWFVMSGQGRGGLSVEDKGWSDSRGALNAMLSGPGFGWAPPKGCKGGRPRPSSESEDISGSSVEEGPEGGQTTG